MLNPNSKGIYLEINNRETFDYLFNLKENEYLVLEFDKIVNDEVEIKEFFKIKNKKEALTREEYEELIDLIEYKAVFMIFLFVVSSLLLVKLVSKIINYKPKEEISQKN
jgi:hypothetical protein